jgi:HD superfamily phosphodiesterase
MLKTELTLRTETYVIKLMDACKSGAIIAHGFQHIDRVRNWALYIAGQEGCQNLETVEVTALLHDIGLTQIEVAERKDHGAIGANIAGEYLRSYSSLDEKTVELVCDAINYHGRSPALVGKHLADLKEKGDLLQFLRDADILDAMGALGLLRAFMSHYYLPEYASNNIKGDDWEFSVSEYERKSGISRNRLAPVNTVIDQVNQQISYYHNLHTHTARELAGPLVAFMRNFIIQMEKEITHH